ncbi:ABC transporter ATP-binding protein [Spiroplasma corruscae]|uniref:ABC transporter ATP-binding protein n=1 Tax=Spiroplasma corruscae TaxID=216934 RepID=A0A222ENE9_9MOLU|nr:ATP-binding cassette domain-containing protein [Spiroplasma corruscae]ASP28018.1 ABC transporter ATP-binding protein [Spiroplasma corruscae]
MEQKDWIVTLENVSKVFNKKIWAIKKVNLKIFRGEGVSVIGPNQSGKSVLGRLIASQIKNTGGILEYNFNQGNALSSIGFQFRQTTWPDGFKIKEIFNLYKEIFNINDKEWLDEIMFTFDITSRWNKVLNSCNTSWLQLFSIALAIIHKPELVVLDEVSSTIGIDFKVRILNFLKKYKENNNATFVIISPDDSTFHYLCNRVVVLDTGLIISDDYTDDWDKNINFETYSLQVMEAIVNKEVQVKPDPIFKPIIQNYEVHYNLFKEQYNKFLEINQEYENEPEIVEVKNINYYINELYNQLIAVSTTALNKKSIESLKGMIHQLITYMKKTKKAIWKIDSDLPYKKSIFIFLDKVVFFFFYLENTLMKIFKSNNILNYASEKTTSMTEKEISKLVLLKKKYIQEEIRLMKQENRIMKRLEKMK